MAQRATWDLPDELGGHLDIFSKGTAVGVIPTMSESSDVVANGQISDGAADFDHFAGVVGTEDGAGDGKKFNVWMRRMERGGVCDSGKVNEGEKED